MDGYQYEQKCAQYLREQGYTNVTVTRGSGDQGVDITAMKDGKKYAIQCKYYEGNVGNKAIQEVYAGAAFYNCSIAMVITNSFFTKSAKELAKKLKVILVEDINAIKLMESSQAAKSTEQPTPVRKELTYEERLDRRCQYILERFRGNPQLDEKIHKFIQVRQTKVNEIASRYRQEYDEISSIRGILFGSSLHSYTATNDNPKKIVAQRLKDELEKVIDEVDAYGRKCLKDGISEASAKMFADFIIETAKSGNKYLQSNGEWSYCDMIKCDNYWMFLIDILPSKYDGPEVQGLRKALEDKHALIQLQEDQIYALKESISRRDTSLAALRKEYKQLQVEIDTCRSKQEKNNAMQAKETAPISQQIETITTQIQQAETEKNHLVQEKNALPLLAFSQRSALREEIKSWETKIASLKADVLGYEQQKESIISKYTKLNETLQNTIDGAVTKQKEDDSEIRQLQSETSKQTLEKNLEQRKKELQKMQDALQNLEKAVAAERITCYKNHFRKGYREPIPYFDFLIRSTEPNKRHWSAPV